MHPVIRIAIFLLLALFLANHRIENLITAAIILLLLSFVYPFIHSLKQSWKIIYRLRWLFFSIVVIYGWFTPGELLIPQWENLSPYKEGVVQGLLRITALILLVFSLTILVLNQARTELISSIYWYCQPMKWLGLSKERLVARLMLTFEAVKQLQVKWQKVNNQVSTDSNKLQQAYQRVLQLFDDVVTTAEQTDINTISVSLLAPPAWYQWSIPLLLSLIFWFI